jgi:hypothetical protein
MSLSAQGGERWLAIVGMASAVICGLTTGSRSIQIFVAAIVTIALVYTPKKHSIQVIGGIIGTGIVSALLWNSSLAQGVIERWEATENGEVGDRIAGTGQPITETLVANPIGIGLGPYTGISSLNGTNTDLPYNESALNKIAAETGVLGCVAALLGVALIVRATRWTLAAQNTVKKSCLLPIAAGAFIQVGLGLWYDHVATGLWWWTIALWLGDSAVARQGRWAAIRPNRRLVAVRAREA